MERKEAIEIIKKNYPDEGYTRLREALEYLIPELKESENERIKKQIVYAIKQLHICDETKNKCLDWLEKKDGQSVESVKREWYNKGYLEGRKNAHIPARKLGLPQKLDIIDVSEEQKDKLQEENLNANSELLNNGVKPKFKAGDWVVVNDGRVGRIIECTKDFADVDLEFSCLSTRVNSIRSWIVQDAKDGDVLATDDWVFIFKELNAYSKPACYCHYDDELGFKVDVNSYLSTGSEIYPATKEQHTLLFQKMHEAGYEWDAEKKELKKIEQKPADLPKGEDYGIDGLYHAIRILEETLGKVDGYQTDDGILEHKCAINAVKELYEQKSAWGEEDEKTIDEAVEYLENYAEYVQGGNSKQYILDLASRVDSLRPKPHWKPSEEQLQILGCARYLDKNYAKELESLYNDLKKLL